VFYFIIIDEINDETDDALEDYSEYIITRALAGEELPSKDNGTNNTYYIESITPEYAKENKWIRYFDEMVYIYSKKETEPARIVKTIFQDSENNYYELTVAIPTIEKNDIRETMLEWIIFLYLVLLIAIIALNICILRKSFKPLYKTLRWLDNFTVEKEAAPLENTTKITEFRKLNDAVIRSAARNIETYEQQKLFIGHASHELQTPLAACKNRLELLCEDPDLTEKQLGEIIKTKQSMEHLIKLNKTLLLLTKIENRQFQEQQEINVNELIKKLIENYSEVYACQNLTINIAEETVLTVWMNDVLASILFGNLLKNAFIHNQNHGMINIVIKPMELSVANTGNPHVLDQDKIFQRFYQGDKKEGSTGLGLALTDSICKVYGLSICYKFTDRAHHFILNFKK
jgi:signal transduction histidine kinase